MFAFGSNGESPAVKLKAWHNVPLTPGRIPSFYIPPKLHLSVSPRFRRPKESDEYQLLPPSSPPSPGSKSPSASPRFPVKLRFTPQSRRKPSKEETSDPTTRAAMSLKHVEKVTTPYGFRALASSPNVSRRESLFHRRRGKEGCQSPVCSPASPALEDSPVLNISDQSPEPCSSARKSERKRLQMLLSKTQTALRTLTPRSRKTHIRKVQDVL
ncbi:C2 calcium-dependent domain-containing protein 4C-like [Silurus asotus]|uniref:C2 calcium-dependent domain-containing protein 4C-like n=1 Tax=Silurus asotus TaxID=30991 RepID=A0AAD5ARW0_SILAS|nr:C2 calcium-dependent domain-containing protein 4C-like [Silurus asotus]